MRYAVGFPAVVLSCLLAVSSPLAAQAILRASSSAETIDTISPVIVNGLPSGVVVSSLTMTKQANASSDTAVTQVGSNIGSLNGNVTLDAAGAANVIGSQLSAANGTVAVVGKTVDIGTAYNTDVSTQSQSLSFSGFSASIGNSVIGAGEQAVDALQQAGNTQNARLSALLDAEAGESVYTGVQAAEKGGLQGGQLSLSLGSSEESSSATTTTSTAVGSSIDGKNVDIQSTVGDITVTGGSITGTNVSFDAKQNLVFNAAQNTSTTTTTSQSSSTSFGVSLALGVQPSNPKSAANVGLPTFSLSTSSSNSNSSTNSTQNMDALVNASGTLTENVGGNEVLNGAQVYGNTVVGNIVGNLDLTSLQDTSTYNESSSSFGAGLSVTGNVVSGSLSTSNGKTNSNYASVIDQTGIFAGAGGFDINVGGNTNLTGAVISSTADPSLNTLNTNTLTYSNIQNTASYTANTSGFGLSVVGTPAGPGVEQGTGLSSSSASGNAASTTDSAISPGTITVRNDAITGQNSLAGLSTDTSSAPNALGQIFNAQTVSEDQEIGDIAGEVGMTAAGQLADSFASSNPQAASLFAEGGIGRDLLHGVVGGVTAALDGGNVLGGAVGATAGAAVSSVPALLGNAGLDLNSPAGSALAYLLADAGSSAVGSAVGGAVGGAAGADSGASSSQQGTIYNLGADQPGGTACGGIIFFGSACGGSKSTTPPSADTVVNGSSGSSSANGLLNGSGTSGDDAETQQFWNLVAQDNGLAAPTTLTSALAASNSSAWYAAAIGAVAVNPGWGSLGGTAGGIGEVGEAGALIGGGLMSGGLLVAGGAVIAAFGGPSSASGTIGTPQPAPGATPSLTTAQLDDSFTPSQSQALYDQLAPLLGLSPTSTSTSLYTPPIASLTGASDASGSQPNTQNLTAAVPNTATPPNPSGSPSPSPSTSPSGQTTGVAGGQWVQVNESMPANSAAYQSYITGAPPGTAYAVNGVTFDGKANGTLIEAKANYDGFVGSDGSFADWFANSPSGGVSMITQARNQLVAADGTPITWYAQTQQTATAISKLFSQNGIDIPVIFKPGP